MSESKHSDSNAKLEESKATVPSNEDLVSKLVSDVEKCVLNEKESSSNENHLKEDTVFSIKNNIVNDLHGESGSSHGEKIEPLVNNTCDDKETEDQEEIPTHEDDLVDELTMKDLELTYTEEDRERLHKEAEVFKQSGNDLFKTGQYKESALAYTQALRTCPLSFQKDRSIFYSNRAAAKMKLELNESAIEDCTKALELDEGYLKALFRRAQLYEVTEKLDEALVDYTKILEIDSSHKEALNASKRLPDEIQVRNEKLKAEMLGKLKDLGNMILKPFGLSTDSFQLNQDPNSGGYSVNFKN